MASQTKAAEGKKSQQELLDYLKTVSVVITDWDSNCLHICNENGSSIKLMISDNVSLRGYRVHYNHTFLVVALSDGSKEGQGGYLVGWVNELTKKKFLIVSLPFSLASIFITNDNKVVLGAGNGTVQLHQLDVNGKHRMIWEKTPHSDQIGDIKVHENKIFSVSWDRKCGVLALSDGSVLHMFNAPDKIYCICVVSDDMIFTGSVDGKVYHHNMSTGVTLMFAAIASNAIYSLGVSLDSATLYCGGYTEILYAIDIKTKSTLWQTKCNREIDSIWVQDGIIGVGVMANNVLCVDGFSGQIISTLPIKPQSNPDGMVIIPTAAVDPHKQCKDEIRPLTSQISFLKEQVQKLTQDLDTANQQAQQAQQHLISSIQREQQLNQQLIASKQQISVLITENDQLKAAQARDQVNALIAKIDNLSGLEVLRIANVLNINVSGVDPAKLASASMLAHDSFDDFFEDIDVDPKHHDGLLRLYSVIKKAKEIGQLPVEHGIAPWIVQQGQAEIAARFDELKYTEDMMANLDPKTVAQRIDVKVSMIKKLQTDFIVSQTSVPRLITSTADAQQSASATGTDIGGSAILMPFDLNE